MFHILKNIFILLRKIIMEKSSILSENQNGLKFKFEILIGKLLNKGFLL